MKFTCILLQTHSEEKGECILVVQRPKVIEKKFHLFANQRIIISYYDSHKLML